MKFEYKNVNHNKLHDELIASAIIPLLVESFENTTRITFPEETDMAAVQAVIDAHDPTPLQPQPTEMQILQAKLNSATEQLEFQEELIVELAMMVYQ